MGVDIRDVEWYSYSYDLWPGSGNWDAAKYSQVAASEDLAVLNASYIQAYADASSPEGYRAGVSTVISDPANKASLTGYHNLAMASENGAIASQTAKSAFSLDGYIGAGSRADLMQMRSTPLSFRAETSLRVDRGSIEGYSDLASASALGITASQQVDAMDGEQIQIGSEARSRTASLFQSLKAARANVITPAEGSLIGYNASAESYDGSVQASQTGQIIGTFTSTAAADGARKTRSSNYGKIYDFDMQARKNDSGSYASGSLGYYVDNVSPTANRIQGAVDASESGDDINVGPGTYFENVQIDKSLDIKGAGAGETVVDGNRSGSVFAIGNDNPDVDVAISDMTIQGGIGTPVEIFPWYEPRFGGGILNYGTLKLKDTIISSNTASFGAGIANIGGTLSLNDSCIRDNGAFGGGGGIYNFDNGTASLNGNSCISGNSAGSSGSGIYNGENSLVILNDNSRVSNNAVTGYYREGGGGISNSWFSTVILNDNSSINDNVASYGGGISNSWFSTVNMNDDSSISNNVLFSSGYDYGGGIYNSGNSLVNMNGSSHISNNTANDGGGISNINSIVNLYGSSHISGNIANFGGGIANFKENTGNCAVNLYGNSHISENEAYNDGGGIHNFGSITVSLNDNSHISDNDATYRGGGVINNGYDTVSLNGSSHISGNTAYEGGGVFSSYHSLVSLNDSSYISDNSATSGGGAYSHTNSSVLLNGNSHISHNIAENGGGVWSSDSSLVSLNDNSYINGNGANYGGGVYSYYFNTVNLNGNSSIVDNAATDGSGVYNFDNSILNLNDSSHISNNSAISGGGVYNRYYRQ